MRAVVEFMGSLAQAGAKPLSQTMSSATADPVAVIGGREVLVFCSSNYLGLATHPEVKRAAIDAVEVYGLGANGSRLVSGTTEVHIALEEATARFKGTEAVIAFPTGFMANTGTIAALAYLPYFARMAGVALGEGLPEMVVLSDELNHASIVEGREAARARHATYEHCDMSSLEEKLEAHRGRRALIVTDAVFSMDGDIAPVPEIVALARSLRRHRCCSTTRTAPACWAAGAGGPSSTSASSAADDILQMGTYSKAFGALGGFVATDAATADYLRVARPLVHVLRRHARVRGGRRAQGDRDRRVASRSVASGVLRNRDYLAHGLRGLGFTVLGDGTPIVPIVIGDDERP